MALTLILQNMSRLALKPKVFTYVLKLRCSNGYPDQLSTIIKLYPEIEKELLHTLQKLCPEKINSRDFRDYKQRVYIAASLLCQFPDIKMEDKDFLEVLLHEDMRHVKEFVRYVSMHQQPKGLMTQAWSSINSFISGPVCIFIQQRASTPT